MDLRKQVGQGSPLRHTLHSQAIQQDRDRQYLDRGRSPYDQPSRAPRDPSFGVTRDTAPDSRYVMRQTQEAPVDSLQNSIHKIDDRHDQLRRQIALKEKLLADMQSERDSARNGRQRSLGTLGSMNKDRFDAPVPGPFGDPSRTNYPLRGSPIRDLSAPPLPGFTDGKRYSGVASTGITRVGASYEGTGADPTRGLFSINNSPDNQKPLQFYPPTRSNFAKTYNKNSPLRNRSNQGRISHGSGSRSKSRSTSNHAGRGIRASQERHVMAASQRIPPSMRGPLGSEPTDAYQQPPIPRAGSPLRHQFPPSPQRDNFIHPQPVEVTVNAVPMHPSSMPPPRPIIGEMGNVGPQVREKLFVDRVEAMMMDNASLQRRLNGVESDLTSLKREKDDLINKLKVMEIDNDRLNRITNQKDELDMSNQTMQEDLEKIRDQNKDLDQKVRVEQHETTRMGGDLNVTSTQKQNLVFESHNIEADLMKTLHRLDELRMAFEDVIRQSDQSQMDIERFNAEDMDLNHVNIDIASAVARIQADRQDLNKRMHELTLVFDDTVLEKTEERRMIDDKRRWQTKILTCKILNQIISKQQRHMVHSSFRELIEYSQFDLNCHNKLKAFSMVCYKVGSYRQKAALHQWYTSVLKPLEFKHQNVDISYMIECNQIQARVFYAWRQYQNDKMLRYQHKTSAIDKTWFLIGRSVKTEKKRAFTIWKDKTRHWDYRGKKMKMLLSRRNDKLRELALQNWKSWSSQLEYAVRMTVLHQDAINKILLSQVFSQLRIQTRFERQKRHRTLAHCIKGWKDYLHYNRHLMHTNMASIQFVHMNQRYTMKACFAELIRHKEKMKYKLLHSAVENDMNPGIKNLEDHNYQKSQEILTRSQYRASTIVRNMMGKRLFAYFMKWKKETDHYNITMKEKVKIKLLQLCKGRFASYFFHWKSNSFNKRNQLDNGMNMDNLGTNEQLQLEAMENEKQLRFNEEFIRTTKRRLMDKTIRKLYNRQLSVAMGQWIGICKLRETQEDRYKLVTSRMRKRFLRDAFNQYLAFFKHSRQHDLNVRGAGQMRYKLNMKTRAKVFNALSFNKNRHQRAKRYWSKILSRMVQQRKMRAMTIWAKNADLKTQSMLNEAQNLTLNDIQKKKQIMTQFETIINEQENEIAKHTKMRMNKAYKQLGNYFMRTYMSQSERYFKIWKQNLRDQEHKKQIMIRTIQHWKKSQFDVVKRIFREFVSKDRQREADEEINRKIIDQNAFITQSNHGIEMAQNLKEESEIATRAIMDEANYRNTLQKKLMLMMERRNKEWIFVSQKRMIFMCWRHASKQQRAFIHCVVNVLDKSMKTKGLHYIKNYHLDNVYHDKVTRMMKKFVNRYQKMNGLDAFNKWKMFSLSQVDEKFNDAMMEKKAQDDAFNDHVAEIKAQNNARCFSYFMDKNKKNIWDAWVTIIKHFKLVRAKEEEFLLRQETMQIKLALRLWQARVEKTVTYRSREIYLIEKLEKRRIRAVFTGLKDQFKSVSDLTKNLSTLEQMMRTKIMTQSFKQIASFAEERMISNGNEKMVGATDCMRMVRQAYYKKLQVAFSRFLNQTSNNSQSSSKLKSLWTKITSKVMRQAFDRWHKQHQKAELLDDQYYCGPVRAEYWEAQREVENLQDFMAKEHHTTDEIQALMTKVNWRTNGLLRKYIIRWRIRQTNKKWLPYIIDRWKQFVAIRKLVRYEFRYCENQVHHVKADLQMAFKKWRDGPSMLGEELQKLPLETLVDLGVRSTNQVAKCSEQLSENQGISNHLMIQRDEFLNYYIKSQVLAMALVKDKTRHASMQAWSRWNRVRRIEYAKDMKKQYEYATYKQAHLELQEKELTAKNEELKNENGDLGSFKKDGNIVRNNLNRIQAEVEQLRSQITETDQDYAQLLEENERIQEQIKVAEAKAKNSKNEKFINTAGLKGAAEGQENLAPSKQKSNVIEVKKVEKEETEAEKKQRERFERLQKNAQGASIR